MNKLRRISYPKEVTILMKLSQTIQRLSNNEQISDRINRSILIIIRNYMRQRKGKACSYEDLAMHDFTASSYILLLYK